MRGSKLVEIKVEIEVKKRNNEIDIPSKTVPSVGLPSILIQGHYSNIPRPKHILYFIRNLQDQHLSQRSASISLARSVQVNLTPRSDKCELISTGLHFYRYYLLRCCETDTPDSAHAPAKLCTNYSTRAFLCHSSISTVRADCAKFMQSKLRCNVTRTVTVAKAGNASRFCKDVCSPRRDHEVLLFHRYCAIYRVLMLTI